MPNIPQGELPKPKSWDEFEDICWDLYTRLWDDPHADRYGRSGEPQHGVDILGRAKYLDGKRAGVQCKRYAVGKLTRAKIRREIREADEFTPSLAEFIIATTDARTAAIQSFVEQTSQERVDAGKFPVYIAFWDTLCGLLTNPDYKDILLKHYGEWVALALRASPPTPATVIPPLPAYQNAGTTKIDQQQSPNLRELRELLLETFSAEGLRALVMYDDKLKKLALRFAPTDSITDLVDKTIPWCDRRALLPYLVQLVKEERPERYKLSEPELFATAAEQPQEAKPPGPTPESLTITSPISLDLVRIPAGEFLMGSDPARDGHARDDESPRHSVHVQEFYLGQYPVTNLQYRAFVNATQTEPPRTWESGSIPLGKENNPVTYISWADALAFCDWLSRESGQPFRLPTEAEWEKAARGTDGRIWPWGNEPPDESQCNFGNRVRDTTPIGCYSPQGDSPYGCADMAGNVTEWCTSLYRRYPYRTGDGREDLEADGRRVLRGGSFLDLQTYVRCAFRNWNHADMRIRGFGFRVAIGPLQAAS